MKLGHRLQFRNQDRALAFHPRQVTALGQIPLTPETQQRVSPHSGQGRGDPEAKPPIHTIAGPTPDESQERQVALSHRLKQPVLLQEPVLIGMSHPRKVSVQHEGERPDHRWFTHGMASGSGNPKIGGCEPTPPRTSVCRAKVRTACRTSIPCGPTACIGTSNRPSGNAQRKVKDPSERSSTGRPKIVTRDPGRVLPKRTTSALTRNSKSSEGKPESRPGEPKADEEISEIATVPSEHGAWLEPPPCPNRPDTAGSPSSELPTGPN